MTNLPKVELMGGLGNQLFQFAFGLNRYGLGRFILGGTHGRPRLNHQKLVELEEYSLPSNVAVIREPQSRVKSKILNAALLESLKSPARGQHRKTGSNIKLFLLEKAYTTAVRSPVKFVVSDNVGFGEISPEIAGHNEVVIGYFQSYKFLDEQTLDTLRSLQYAGTKRNLQEFKQMAKRVKPIILHIRLGDYFNEPAIGVLPLDYYKKAIEKIRISLPQSPIWVFSNDLPKARQLLQDLNVEGIVFIEDDWNSSVLTLEIMRLGVGYIIANSTFSYWAAMLSHDKAKIVFAPDPWFLGQPSPKMILHPDWLTIKSN